MPRTYADLLKEARAQIREVTPQQVDALAPDAAIVIDVREASEWEQGHLPGAVHISKSYVEQQVEAAAPDRDAEVILYCAGGVRSLFAAQTLEQLGYTNVASMSGGFQAWKSAGLPWEAPTILSPERALAAAGSGRGSGSTDHRTGRRSSAGPRTGRPTHG